MIFSNTALPPLSRRFTNMNTDTIKMLKAQVDKLEKTEGDLKQEISDLKKDLDEINRQFREKVFG